MGIKIITIHAMYNPGSFFQAYALQKYLEEKTVEIIDYRPAYFFREGSRIKHFLKIFLFGRAYKKRKEKFDFFVSRYLRLTNRYNDYAELASATWCDDLYITGSDQLWNTDYECGWDPAFYLEFVTCGKKISYSTSIGRTDLSLEDLKRLKSKLEKFLYISVREQSSAEQLTSFFNRKVFWVCDPVFLLPRKHYMSFINNKRPIEKRYVMIYMLGSSPQLDFLVERYRSQGYLIVLVGGFTRRCKCDMHVKDAGPDDFLNYIFHAELIVSSSFHATAFSLIFQKDFFVFLPERNGERITSLLKLVNLEDRILNNENSSAIKLTKINWDDVNHYLSDYISTSQEYLRMAVNINSDSSSL